MITSEQKLTDIVDLTNEIIANGEICFNEGDINSAITAFRSVLDIDPDNVRANSNLGVVLWQSEDHENALEYLKRAYLANPDDKVALTNLAEVYLALQQDQEALRLYNAYLYRHPDENEIRNILKTLQVEQNPDTETSRTDIIELTKEIIANGEICFNEGDINSAITAFRSVLEIDPDNVRANSNLGVALWNSEVHENALEYLKRAYLANPDDIVALTNLAEVYLALQQDQEALRLYNAYLDRHPDENEIRNILKTLQVEPNEDTEVSLEIQLLRRADKLHESGETGAALKILEAVLTLSKDPLIAHRKIGELCRHSGQHGKAIEHLTKAYQRDSSDRATALALSDLFCANKQYEAAAHTCSTFLTLKPNDHEINECLKEYQMLDNKKKTADSEAAAANANEIEKNKGKCPIARVPEMDNVLNALSDLGVEVKAILDVGVLHGTPPLMKKFPDLKHYLFEPINDHFDIIRRNYAKFDFKLIHVALSDSDGEAWQNSLCNDGSGNTTHSQISDKPGDPETDSRLIKSQRVPMAKLDTLLEGINVATPYLLKLDVDGHEIPILEGAQKTLKNADVVVIEATAGTFLDRANFLAEEGFVLFDIVDFAYYSGVLHQVDIIFIRKDLRDKNDRLHPMANHAFKPSHWYQVSANWFSK